MSDPTPEEKPILSCYRAALDRCIDLEHDVEEMPCPDCIDWTAEIEIRAAVEAEREACLKEVQRIRDMAEFHQTQRDPVSICFTIAAAIRARGEGE
jgi:hypothetical protein